MQQRDNFCINANYSNFFRTTFLPFCVCLLYTDNEQTKISTTHPDDG